MNLTKYIQGYIKQADILTKRGNPAFYNNFSRLSALDRLLPLLLLTAIHPKTVVANKDNLVDVLPHPTNKGYETTKGKLLFAINYSLNFLQNENHNQGQVNCHNQN